MVTLLSFWVVYVVFVTDRFARFSLLVVLDSDFTDLLTFFCFKIVLETLFAD